MSKLQQLKAAAKAEAAAATVLAEKAGNESRTMTTDEQSKFDAHLAKGRELVEQMKAAKADENIVNQARELVGNLGGPDNGKAPVGRRGWAKSATEAIRSSMTGGSDGQKALISGTITVNNPISDGVITDPTAPVTILDLLTGRNATTSDPYRSGSYRRETIEQLQAGLFGGDGGGGNTFTFLRQTVRENNAAPVADGAQKPTSLYTIEEIEGRYRVIAHLSEAIPQRYFHDDAQLGEFLASEMALGLEQAVEYQVLHGDGTGENLTGILNTSGIKVQAYAADPVATARKALTKLQAEGMAPTAWALNPADAETFDLLREGATSGQYILGGPGSDSSKQLWTIPTALSTSVPVGTALLADWKQAELRVRQEATLHVDTSGTLFDKNQVRFRMEGRYGLGVKRPGAFVKVSLAGA